MNQDDFSCTPFSVDKELHDLMRAHHNTMRQYFQSHGLFNGQPPMMFHIFENPGLTQKELAALMHITPASVATSIRRMEAEGLVERQVDRQDARIHHLYLTPKGVQLDAECRKARDIIIETLYEDCTQEELEQMHHLFTKMYRKLDKARSLFPAKLLAEEPASSREEGDSPL